MGRLAPHRLHTQMHPHIDGHESKPANSNFSIFFYLINSKVIPFYIMCKKISFLACCYTPHFDNCQNRLSHTQTLFNETKLASNPHSATTTISDTNIKRPL